MFRWKFPTVIASIDSYWQSVGSNPTKRDYGSLSLKEKQPVKQIIIFVVSTTGQGEAPDNMRRFWKCLLSRHLPATFLECWRFAVFGLGDSRYPQFNFVARKLRNRLKQLSATEFYRLGLGDEQHDFGYVGEFDVWLEGVGIELHRILNIPYTTVGDSLSDILYPPYYNVKEILKNHTQCSESAESICTPPKEDNYAYVPYFNIDGTLHTTPNKTENNESVRDSVSGYNDDISDDSSRLISGKIISNDRISSAEHFQTVHHIQISLPNDVYFRPGDSLSIYPRIPEPIVLRFIEDTLERQRDTQVMVEPTANSVILSSPFPCQTNLGLKVPNDTDNSGILSLYNIFSFYLDITAVPNRYFFLVLAYFATDEQQKKRLLEFSGSSLESRNAYYDYCKSERRSIAEVLWDFNSCITIPLDYLFSIIPVIEPRRYSAASTPFWYSKPLWWALGASTLVSSPLLWGVSAPLAVSQCFKHSTKKESRVSRCFWDLFRVFYCNNKVDKTEINQNFETAQSVARKCQRFQWESDWASSIRQRIPSYKTYNNDNRVDICVAGVNYVTKLQRHVKGLCSNYLIDLKEGSTVNLTLQCGIGFGSQWQPHQSSPLFMIGPGTGLSPCRALLQQRYLQWEDYFMQYKHLHSNTRCLERPGPVLLTLGFRHPDKDFLFKGEWTDMLSCSIWKKNENLMQRHSFTKRLLIIYQYFVNWLQHLNVSKTGWEFLLLVAFSRYNAEKTVYVQDILRENKKKIAEFLLQSLTQDLKTTLGTDSLTQCSLQKKTADTVVIVSGRSHPMPAQVLQELNDIVVEYLGINTKCGEQFFEKKRQQKSLIFDTWG